MSIDFTRSIVAILDTRAIDDIDNRTVGTGFVVSEDGLIATCKHVIDSSYSNEVTYLLFYDPALPKAQREIRRARLIPEYVRGVEAEDVAFLRLEELPPPEKSIIPLPLGRSYHTQGQIFRTFGFPPARTEDGVFGECKVIGYGSENGMPWLQISSDQVSRGFSGAPVWDDHLQCVIGMVTSIIGSRTIRIAGKELPIASDPDQRQTETGFITPVETLTKICTPLQTSEVSPYRGLSFFTEEDAGFFFGREQYVIKLLRKLRRNMRFLPVFGPSGSGKSSVVRAGLIPRLRAGELADSARWHTFTIRPADDPFSQLTQLLADTTDLVESVKAWFVQHPQYTRFMLVIDQFEELLLLTPPDTRQNFVRQLTRLLDSPLSITVVAVMRDDFYKQFVDQESLREWLERSGGATNVPLTLSIPEITAIVEKPARAARLRFEEGLVQLIVRDMLETVPPPVEKDPSSEKTEHEQSFARSTNLPLLEFTLQQLWEKRVDGMLTYEAYQQIGGVTGGLTQWADQVFYGLQDETKQRQARRIFTKLVRLGDENRRPPDSRRLLPLSALYYDEREQELIRQVVQQLADAKLLITTYDLQSKQEVVEIIHDALLWEWGQLDTWLKKDREFLAWRQEIERQAQLWRASGYDKAKLLQGTDLKKAMERLEQRHDDLYQEEQEFIQKSWSFHQRRKIFSIVGVVTVIAIAGGVGLDMLLAQRQVYSDIASYSHSGPIRKPIYSVVWSPEASRVASGSADTTIEIHTSNGGYIYTYKGHTSTVSALSWSHDGFRLASASLDGTVQVWNADGQNQGKSLVYRGHRGAVLTVAWSPRQQSTHIVSGGSDLTTQVWDAITGELLFVYTRQKGPVNTVAWSPNGKYVASGCGQDPISGSGDNSIHVWDPLTGVLIWKNTGHTSHVLSVSWAPDGKYIASAGWDRKVQVLSASTGKVLYIYRGHTGGAVNSVAWSPDSELIASASSDRTVQIWKVSNGELLCTYKEHYAAVESVGWSSQPGEKRLVSAGDDTTVRLWQLM